MNICLSMIVKNEEAVLQRCLRSVRPFVSSYSIVLYDTADGSAGVVERELADLSGKVHSLPWPNHFGIARTRGLRLAEEDSPSAEYILTMDADDELSSSVNPPGELKLTSDAYLLCVRDDTESRGDVMSYWRLQFFRARAGFKYEGGYHEVLTRDVPFTESRIVGLDYIRHSDGASNSDPLKYHRAAQILKKDFSQDPNNTRTAFYLAQTLLKIEDHVSAREIYTTRIAMKGGWDEEVWFSLLQIARIAILQSRPDDEVVDAFLRAYEHRPRRAEPLCYLAKYLRSRGREVAALPFATSAQCLPRPDDGIYLDEPVYAWRAKDEYALALCAAGHVKQSLDVYLQLLDKGTLPADQRERVLENISLCLKNLPSSRLRA